MQNDKEKILKELLSSEDYDYRQAYLDNQEPEVNETDGQYHWASKDSKGNWLKSPYHPTAWKEVFYNSTKMNPDDMPMMDKKGANEILRKENLPQIEEQLPRNWKKRNPFGSDEEPKFRKWLMNTEWFKNIHQKQTADNPTK